MKTTYYFTSGGIIEECCLNPCTRSQLRQYCQKKPNDRTHPVKQQHSDSSTTGPRDQLSLIFSIIQSCFMQMGIFVALQEGIPQ